MHVSSVQRYLMAYIFRERQHIDFLKTQALVIASLTAAPKDADRDQALRAFDQYMEALDRSKETHELEKEELVKKMAEEANAVYRVTFSH